MTKLIVIDPGHCREEPGSVQVDGELEATYTLALAMALRDGLVNGYDCKVALTREGEEGMVPGGTLADELRARGELPNRLKADFFLSIHHNAAGVPAARGAELYIHTNRRTAGGDLVWLPALAEDGTPNHTAPNSYRLAATMQPIVRDALAEFGIPWRGDPDRIMCCDFAVLRYPNLPCALIETHFGTNPEDNAAADRPEFKTRVAHGIARAIGTALELPPKGGWKLPQVKVIVPDGRELWGTLENGAAFMVVPDTEVKVPIRAVAELMGRDVRWVPDPPTVVVK